MSYITYDIVYIFIPCVCVFVITVELNSEAKEMFERFLKEHNIKQDMSNTEWRKVYEKDGPFESEEQLETLNQELQNPKDFMVIL